MPDIAATSAHTHQHRQALALFQEGKYEEAAQILAEALQGGESSELWNDWATAQLVCRQTAESERGYRRALELDPRSSRAAGNLGVLLARQARVPEALALLERAANGSSGAEREQLLCLIQAYRTENPSEPPVGAPLAAPGSGVQAYPTQNPPAAGAKSSPETNLLLKMAAVIHQQSQSIARLGERVAAIESGFTRPAIRPPQTVPAGPRSTAGLTAQPWVSNTTRTTPHRDGAATQACTAAAVTPADSPSQKEAPQPGIYFSGVVYGGSGYAEEGWAAALGLAQHEVPVQLVPIDQRSDLNNLIPEFSRKRLESLERQLVDIPKSVIFQSSPAPWWNSDWVGRVRVGRTMFETDRLPDVYRDACNSMDEVWVPSRFNMETFAKAGVDQGKLRLVSGGVDACSFRPGAAPLEIPRKRAFNFLSVFDWHRREGYDVLLRAYLREFTPDDDVALILKVCQITGSSDLEAMVCHFIECTAGLPMEKSPTVILLNGFIPQSEMARLYATADAFVLPSRGEAYGRPYLEAMACGLPVIATKWSGQLDFLNNQNSYLIDSQLVSVPPGVEIEYYRGHCWAEPDTDHLRQLMRDVYSRRGEARGKAELGREDVLKNYDWSVLIPRWVREFQRLLN